MPSQSSPRKNALKPNRECVVRLLQDGTTIRDPAQDLLDCAGQLQSLGILAATRHEYVLCANPGDKDFPPRNRHCKGRIYLPEKVPFRGREGRCPECERRVFDDQYDKRSHTELRCTVLQEGVLRYVEAELTAIKAPVRHGPTGVFRIDLGQDPVTVCVVDYCSDARYLARERALCQPSCFLAVQPRDFEQRFLAEAWVRKALLSDLVCGTTSLKEMVERAAAEGLPATVQQVSVPIYSGGPSPILVENTATPAPTRHFVVEVGERTVRVEGLEVIAPQAGPRLDLFRTLWDCFLDDLKKGTEPAAFEPKRVGYLAEELSARQNRNYDDEGSVRRLINRLQQDIEEAVKSKLGLAIDREDIIQTCSWSGQGSTQHGYRINPFTVLARPFQTDMS